MAGRFPVSAGKTGLSYTICPRARTRAAIVQGLSRAQHKGEMQQVIGLYRNGLAILSELLDQH
jgi:hypothetical protein